MADIHFFHCRSMTDNDKWASVGSHSSGDLSVRCTNLILTLWHKTRKVFCEILPVISLQCCCFLMSEKFHYSCPITQTRLNCTFKRVCIQNKQNGEWKAVTWDVNIWMMSSFTADASWACLDQRLRKPMERGRYSISTKQETNQVPSSAEESAVNWLYLVFILFLNIIFFTIFVSFS